jgi:hypothetical protein
MEIDSTTGIQKETAGFRFPAPKQAKALTMPTGKGIGFHDA